MWYIAASFYAFPYIPQCKIKEIKRKSEIIGILLIFVTLLIPIAFGVDNIAKAAKEEKLLSKAMSNDAVKAIKEDNPQRIFNDYNVGETLIYHDIPVFFDARADLYRQEHILEDGVSLMFLEQANKESEISYVNVESLMNTYDFDAILILKSRPLYAYLISHPEQFSVCYENDTVSYFRRVYK